MTNISLDDFVEDQILMTRRFRSQWVKKNLEDPDNFPLVLPKDNAGVWDENFMFFLETGEL